jgi:hypothetical protein
LLSRHRLLYNPRASFLVRPTSAYTTSSAASPGTRIFTDQTHHTIKLFSSRYLDSRLLVRRSSTLLKPFTLVKTNASPHLKSSMESSPLGAIPPELIFQISDFMRPHEVSGLSCTCQRALWLVNLYLDPYKFGGYQVLFCGISSRTAYFVKENRACLDGAYLVPYYQDSGCAAYDPSEDELYL